MLRDIAWYQSQKENVFLFLKITFLLRMMAIGDCELQKFTVWMDTLLPIQNISYKKCCFFVKITMSWLLIIVKKKPRGGGLLYLIQYNILTRYWDHLKWGEYIMSWTVYYEQFQTQSMCVSVSLSMKDQSEQKDNPQKIRFILQAIYRSGKGWGIGCNQGLSFWVFCGCVFH